MSKVSVARVCGVGCWFVVVDGCGGNDKPKFELERVAVRTDEAVLRLDVAVQVATTVDGAHCVFCVCLSDDGDDDVALWKACAANQVRG